MVETSGHIDGLDRLDHVKPGSERSFGIVFTVALLVFVYKLLRRCPKCHRFFALEGGNTLISKYCSHKVFRRSWDFDTYD